MRIHLNTTAHGSHHGTDAAANLIRTAARTAGVDLVKMSRHGSRSHVVAYDVNLEGDSPRRPNGGHSGAGTGYAATWDQWGIFLGVIFDADPTAKSWAYESGEHFDWTTGGRFRGGRLNGEPCRASGHRWSYDGQAVTGSYDVSSCEYGCGALTRRMTWGHKFAELASV